MMITYMCHLPLCNLTGNKYVDLICFNNALLLFSMYWLNQTVFHIALIKLAFKECIFSANVENWR